MTETRVRSLSTPLRQREFKPVDGCRVLASPGVAYLDGSEAGLLEVMRRATDLSSTSDELERHGLDWASRYHVATARANIVRALDLPREAAVLEIGAGCGAVTRYLGEVCAAVDAVEPVLDRARVARARTRGQDNVEVFVGTLADVPDGSAYDAVLVIGVLEYVANGGADSAPYVEFLRRCRSLVRPGGLVVVAIENGLGVKYLAGAPEDHSGRAFDSLEGYASGTPARCFSRAVLASMFEEAGLVPQFLHAFPDYKLTRAVLSDALIESEPALAVRIPNFPSPDWDRPRARGVDEQRLWRTLVDARLGQHFANSFLVLGANGTADAFPWRDDRLAVFFSQWRLSRYLTRTEVVRAAGAVNFKRSRLTAEPDLPGSKTIFEVESASMVVGQEMLEALADADDAGLRSLLQGWLGLVETRTRDDAGMPVDLLPHNVVIAADGQLSVIDQEWRRLDYTRDDVVKRGTLLTGTYLANRTPASRWPFTTVRELVAFVGRLVGLDERGDWIDAAVDRESRFQAEISPGRVDSPNDRVEEFTKAMQALLDTALADMALGVREHEHAHADDALKARSEAAEAFYRSSLQQIYSSTSWRLTKPLRAAGALARRLRRRRSSS